MELMTLAIWVPFLRTADWFGIDKVICSDDCVELYNPKVVQKHYGGYFQGRCIVYRP
jgi:TrmH family RNA methyltransferase